jgi:hypothetical protein
MDAVLAQRLRSHRLTARAASATDAAAHMLATQAQDFGGGRWALAVRTRGEPTVHDVDAVFDRGDLVRSWTQRGTIHIVPAADLAWMLSLTADRQLRAAAATHRREGIDDGELARAERAVRAALRGGGRLTRAELFDVLRVAGVTVAGQRGYHLLCALSLRGVVCQGPLVPREGGPTREQHIVLCEEWIADAASPADPSAELFARYIDGHGPATVRDFAWWSGLPLGASRSAAEAASDRVRVIAGDPEPQYEATVAPRRTAGAPTVIALPPFDEYYLSYADRATACTPEIAAAVGPGRNGMVRPILVARGEVVGVWAHSLAVGRHAHDPVPELLAPGAATDAEIADALARYRRFITA